MYIVINMYSLNVWAPTQPYCSVIQLCDFQPTSLITIFQFYMFWKLLLQWSRCTYSGCLVNKSIAHFYGLLLLLSGCLLWLIQAGSQAHSSSWFIAAFLVCFNTGLSTLHLVLHQWDPAHLKNKIIHVWLLFQFYKPCFFFCLSCGTSGCFWSKQV